MASCGRRESAGVAETAQELGVFATPVSYRRNPR
jgi:hypothetical protein